MPLVSTGIVRTSEERQALTTLIRAGRGWADLAQRARIIVRVADGASYADLIRLGESSRPIAKTYICQVRFTLATESSLRATAARFSVGLRQ